MVVAVKVVAVTGLDAAEGVVATAAPIAVARVGAVGKLDCARRRMTVSVAAVVAVARRGRCDGRGVVEG